MTRRALLGAFWFDDRGDIIDVFTRLAGALSEENPAAFLAQFDPAMAGYGTLESDVRALVRQFEIASSIELLSFQGEGSRRTVEVDWFLELRPRQPATSLERRRLSP